MILLPKKILRVEIENLLISMVGILMKLRNYGVLDLKLQDPTFYVMPLKPFNILTKSRILWKLPSNGQPKKEL